jgi:DNA (cytosine-5)-methyltransferase 1
MAKRRPKKPPTGRAPRGTRPAQMPAIALGTSIEPKALASYRKSMPKRGWKLAIQGRWSDSPYHSGHRAYLIRRHAPGVWVMKCRERNPEPEDGAEELVEEVMGSWTNAPIDTTILYAARRIYEFLDAEADEGIDEPEDEGLLGPSSRSRAIGVRRTWRGSFGSLTDRTPRSAGGIKTSKSRCHIGHAPVPELNSKFRADDPGMRVERAMTKYTFVDLFCGCGGFTLGMIRAGFACEAAIDFDESAVATLRSNLPDLKCAINRDLTQFAPAELAKLIRRTTVDVIVGGPPCQGFSTARQVDGANHGRRLVSDPRRHLYREFLRYVRFFSPRVFVMENVLGIRTAAGGAFFTAVQSEARALGYRVHGQIEDAWELGVPQKRRRQLIVGVRKDVAGYFPTQLGPAPRAIPRLTLGPAIGDLPALAAGEGDQESSYCLDARRAHLRKSGSQAARFLRDILEVSCSPRLWNHQARPHNPRDLRDFRRLREGESSATAIRDRGVRFEFPYDTGSFADRYTRQSRSDPCSTIVAHLSKDGLMFIHPTQNRSITPREAARIQTFPDWFRFPAARTHAFRLIGNAVPPLVGEAVGSTIREFLDREATSCRPSRRKLTSGFLRSTAARAVLANLQSVAGLPKRDLRSVSIDEFTSHWRSIFEVFPELHPANAVEHGEDVIEVLAPDLSSSAYAPFRERFARTSWPVCLAEFGEEAWRRHDLGELSLSDLCPRPRRQGRAGSRPRVLPKLAGVVTR